MSGSATTATHHGPFPVGGVAGIAASVGLEIVATARWPDGAAEPPPSPVAGFIASSFSPLVAEVAERCLRRHYGTPPADPDRAERTAVVIASGSGDVATAVAVAHAVDARRRVSPLLFFQAVPNAVAGHISARWGLGGPVVCLGVASDDITDGLAAAALLIDDGDADEALIVVAEQGYSGKDDPVSRPDHAFAILARRCAAATSNHPVPPPTEGVQP